MDLNEIARQISATVYRTEEQLRSLDLQGIRDPLLVQRIIKTSSERLFKLRATCYLNRQPLPAMHCWVSILRLHRRQFLLSPRSSSASEDRILDIFRLALPYLDAQSLSRLACTSTRSYLLALEGQCRVHAALASDPQTREIWSFIYSVSPEMCLQGAFVFFLTHLPVLFGDDEEKNQFLVPIEEISTIEAMRGALIDLNHLISVTSKITRLDLYWPLVDLARKIFEKPPGFLDLKGAKELIINENEREICKRPLDLSPLKTPGWFPLLTVIELHHCKITSLEVFAAPEILVHVHFLDLSDNAIADVGSLEDLSVLPSLRALYLGNNRIQRLEPLLRR
ncbi:MAG: leucine-rich repeat domain-containing protein, partial [Chlamydiia bacterium]|nr:leucine-rich repeat domain-containing protein [Chlamydiia bacterium]